MISVIIPTLEEERYLPLILQDFKSQLQQPDEVIVVDAKSKDRTVEVAKAWKANIIISKTKNPALQRNAGATSAKGDILIFVDADVRLRDQRIIQEAVKSLKNHIALTARVDVIKEERSIADTLTNATSNIVARFFPKYAGRGAFMAVKKSDFKKVGGFDPKRVVAEDLDLFRRLAKLGPVACLDPRVEESPRRYRAIGHLNVIASWLKNGLHAALTNRSKDKEWKAVR